MNTITVVIINWNSWDILQNCLSKLQFQTLQNFDILIIDNASKQAPPYEFLSTFTRLKLIENSSNLGFAAANNQAIQLLKKSKWLALLNPDAFPEPTWLEELMEAAKQNPDFSIFASRQLMAANLNKIDGDGDIYNISGLVWRKGYGKTKNNQEEPQEIFTACAAAALYKREALVSAGGFDEDFFCYLEDVDLGFRLSLMGYRCLLVPKAIVAHLGSATSGGSHSNFALYHGHRNLVWVYLKNMPGYLFWACLPLHITMNLFTVAWFIINGKGLTILQSKWDALCDLNKMYKKRRLIQRTRRVAIKKIWQNLNKNLFPSKKYR